MIRRKVLTLGIIFIMSIASIPALALETDQTVVGSYEENTIVNNNKDISTQLISQAKNWLQENYEDFYDIRNINAHIVRIFNTAQKSRYTVSMMCETKYKYNSVEEIPFVQGMLNECQKKTLSQREQNTLNNQIKQIAEDASFGEYTQLCVDVVIEIDNTDTSAPWKMYYQDGMDTTLHDIETLKLDEQELYNSGKQVANEILARVSENIEAQAERGYSSYDRFAARDYARQFSSNATGCDSCSGCGVLQDRSKWNTSQYPYFSVFKHNDCADFVSQAMSVGGIPEKSGWYRTKNGASGTWTNSWTTVSSLKTYMTRSDHVYWDDSTFSACNAGNILITNSGGHVVMVDFNDGTTHKFTGHTNDRKSYVFGNVSGYQYYVINRNS